LPDSRRATETVSGVRFRRLSNHSPLAATAAELSAAAGKAGAFALSTGSKDAAMVLTLAAGPSTAHVSSPSGQTGIALIEVYELPE